MLNSAIGTDIASFDISITGGDGGDGGWQNGGSFFAGPAVHRKMTGDIILIQIFVLCLCTIQPVQAMLLHCLINNALQNPLYDPACPGYAALQI